MKCYKLITITFLALLFSKLTANPFEKNIHVMEGILDKLIVEKSPIYFSYGNDFQGNYYDGFGIILSAKSSSLLSIQERLKYGLADPMSYLNIDYKGKDLFKDMNEKERKKIQKKRREKVDELRKEKKQLIQETIQQVEEELINFFMNYTRSALTLPEKEQIMIRIDIKDNFKSDNITPVMICGSVSVADLKQYFNGKISDSNLKRRITINKPTALTQNKDIEVMANIFDTFLEKGSKFWETRHATTGYYLEGYGAIFNIPANITPKLPFKINTGAIQKKLEAAQKSLMKYQVKLEKEMSDNDSEKTAIFMDRQDDSLDHEVDAELVSYQGYSDAQLDSILQQTKKDIIKTLSIYGSTLKSVKKNENIYIHIDLNRYDDKKSINLKARKKDIMHYTSGKLDYEKFSDRIQEINK